MVDIVTTAAAVYVAANGALYLFQRRLVFAPSGVPGEPQAAGVPEMAWVSYATGDGLTLRAWYAPAKGDRPTLVYFHGNAGHFGDRAYKARYFIDQGYGFLLTSYRGYSGNPGRPTEERVYQDARAALDFLLAQGVPEAQTVIYGESLGTGIATQMARERPAAALVLEAPFTSLPDVAAGHYWWTPARWLLRDRFESAAKIDAIGMPLLIVHGERDRTVPVKLGRRLFAAAIEPKEFHLLPEAGHADVYEHGAGEIVHDFLARRVG
jgi:fermentation-respiration switch protein FrsA (DUF1100 family)